MKIKYDVVDHKLQVQDVPSESVVVSSMMYLVPLNNAVKLTYHYIHATDLNLLDVIT
jgi:hypothetical protein